MICAFQSAQANLGLFWGIMFARVCQKSSRRWVRPSDQIHSQRTRVFAVHSTHATTKRIQSPNCLQTHTPEPERIADNRHGTQGHGRGRDDRAEQNPEERVQNPRRHWHASHVVHEGKE